jgi:hypothetical protein
VPQPDQLVRIMRGKDTVLLHVTAVVKIKIYKIQCIEFILKVGEIRIEKKKYREFRLKK